MEDGVLLKEMRDNIMVLTINRPEAMNCFDMFLLKIFRKTLSEIQFDNRIKVIIITGATAGKNAFSTGADLKERAGMSPDQVRLYIYYDPGPFYGSGRTAKARYIGCKWLCIRRWPGNSAGVRHKNCLEECRGGIN